MFSTDTPARRIELTALLLIGILPFEVNGLYDIHLVNNPLYYWIAEIISWMFLPLAVYFWGIHRSIFSNKEIGFHLSAGSRIAHRIVLLVILPPLLYLAYKYFRLFAICVFPTNYGFVSFSYRQVVLASGARRILALLYLAVTAGLVEEFFYRGLMYRILCWDKGRFMRYVLCSSLIFSSVHWELGIRGLLYSFLLGLVYASIYYKTKNLWPLVVGHMLTDLIAFG